MKAMLIVWLKELRELVRDRRTLMLSLLMGPLLAPLLVIGMAKLGESKARDQLEKPLSVAIVGAEHAPNLVAWLHGQGIERKDVADPDGAIRSQAEDVYLRISDDYGKDWSAGTPAVVELVHDPRNVILDEPTNGLDVMTTRGLREFLRQLRGEGRCVIFSSHIMQEVAALCDRIVVVAHGRVVAQGSADALRAQTGEDNLEDAFVQLIGSEEGLHA